MTRMESPAKSVVAVQVQATFAGTILASEQLTGTERQFGIGSDEAADFIVGERGLRLFALVCQRDSQFYLRAKAHWQARLCTEGQVRHLDEHAEAQSEVVEIPVPAEGSLFVRIDDLEFAVHATLPVRRLAASTSVVASAKAQVSALASLTLLLALALLLQQGTSPSAEGELLPIQPDRWVQIVAHNQVPSPLARARAKTQRLQTALQAPREKKEDNEEPEPPSDENTPEEIKAAQADARNKAESAGMFTARSAKAWRRLKELDQASYDSSRENIDSYGDSNNLDERSGAWGHGLRKIGPGSGDGKDWGTVKTGKYRLATAKDRGDEYEANALTRPHKAQAPLTNPGLDAIENSGFHHDVIRGQLGMRTRVLGRCLDKLDDDTERPNHLVLNLHIRADGQVEQASAQDIQESPVQRCLQKVLLSIHLPKSGKGKDLKLHGFSLRM